MIKLRGFLFINYYKPNMIVVLCSQTGPTGTSSNTKETTVRFAALWGPSFVQCKFEACQQAFYVNLFYLYQNKVFVCLLPRV